MRFLYLFLKRLFDMGCALLGLVVSAPLWLIIALGIYAVRSISKKK